MRSDKAILSHSRRIKDSRSRRRLTKSKEPSHAVETRVESERESQDRRDLQPQRARHRRRGVKSAVCRVEKLTRRDRLDAWERVNKRGKMFGMLTSVARLFFRFAGEVKEAVNTMLCRVNLRVVGDRRRCGDVRFTGDRSDFRRNGQRRHAGQRSRREEADDNHPNQQLRVDPLHCGACPKSRNSKKSLNVERLR